MSHLAFRRRKLLLRFLAQCYRNAHESDLSLYFNRLKHILKRLLESPASLCNTLHYLEIG